MFVCDCVYSIESQTFGETRDGSSSACLCRYCCCCCSSSSTSSTSSYEQPSSLPTFPILLNQPVLLLCLFSLSLSLFTPRLSSPSLFPRALLRHHLSLVRPLTYPSHLSFDQRETCLAAHPHCFLLTILESQSPIKTRRESLLPRLLPFCSDPILQPRGPTSQRELRTPAGPSRQHLKYLNYLRRSPNYQLPGVPPVSLSLFSATHACQLAGFLYYGQCCVHLIRSDLHA